MSRRIGRVLLLAAVAAACAGSGDAPAGAAGTDSAPTGGEVDREEIVQAQDSLVMPELPRAEPGRLVTASAGRDSLDGSWPAAAHRCLAPPSLLIMSEEGDVGVALLLALPDSGAVPDSFPVHHPDTALVAGHARVAVQVFHARRPAALEGHGGSVRLERADGPVSGTFAVQLRNMVRFDSVLVRGVFRRLPLDTLPAALCVHEADTTAS